jgi:hypothetical protein
MFSKYFVYMLCYVLGIFRRFFLSLFSVKLIINFRTGKLWVEIRISVINILHAIIYSTLRVIICIAQIIFK